MLGPALPLLGIVSFSPCQIIQMSNKHIPQRVFRPEPPHPRPLETHFLELLRRVGGLVKFVEKGNPHFLGAKIRNLLGFFDGLKSFFGSRLHGVCMRRCGTSAIAVYALFGHFCYVSGFGNFGDPVLRILRGASGDVTIYAY